MIHKAFLGFLWAMVVFSACKRTARKTHESKEIVVNSEPTKPKRFENAHDTIPQVVDAVVTVQAFVPIELKKADFKYLTIKSKAEAALNGKELNFTANVRIAKDSLIWMSASMLGLEGVRMKITQDSLFAIDRLNREAYKYSFKTLSDMLKFELNFALVQSIFLGELPFAQNKDDVLTGEAATQILTQQRGDLRISNKINTERLIEQILTKHLQNGSSLTINFSDFETESGLQLPTDIFGLGSGASNNVQVRFKTNGVQKLAQSPGFNFSIPSGYLIK